MNRYSGAVKCFAASCALSIFPLASFAQNYVQTNLVSDIPQVPNAKWNERHHRRTPEECVGNVARRSKPMVGEQ